MAGPLRVLVPTAHSGYSTVRVIGSWAAWWNWTNSRTGFWLNLALTLPVDLALVVVLIPPDYVDLVGGLFGPAVMMAAIADRSSPATKTTAT